MTRQQFAASFCREDWAIVTKSWKFLALFEAGRLGDAEILAAKLLSIVPLGFRLVLQSPPLHGRN